MRRIGFIISTILFVNSLVAQDKNAKFNIIEQRVELIAENSEEEDIDLTTLFDELYFFISHPINLNHTTTEQLQSLRLLSDLQIFNLLEHISANGKLLTIYELQAIKGINLEIIRNILPFVKVSADFDAPKITLKNLIENGKHEIFLRGIRMIEDQQGYSAISDSELVANPNSRYLGDQNKLYIRYRFKLGTNISVGFTGEKDAGESLDNGLDFNSAHLYLAEFGKLKQLAIGDYQIQFGQGLTFWSGRAGRKTADVLAIKRNPIGIKPYTSVDENRFLRGVATSVDINKFNITGFYSIKNIDANISGDTLSDDQATITSFQTSGLHRTPSELLDRKAIGEIIYGGQIAYTTRRLNVGLIAVQSLWDADVNRNLKIYNQFEFNDNNNLNLGAHYNYLYKNFNLFGEVSRSSSGGIAYASGALISLDPNFMLSLIHRNYDRNYHSMYNNGFTESTKSSNEQGTYIGFEAKPLKHFTISAYFDAFKYPWIKSTTSYPNTSGIDIVSQIKYKPSKQLEMYVRYKTETSPITVIYLDEFNRFHTLRIIVRFKEPDLTLAIKYQTLLL